jgi:hypothetical protein
MNLRFTAVGTRCADHATPFTCKSRHYFSGCGGRSVGIFHLGGGSVCYLRGSYETRDMSLPAGSGTCRLLSIHSASNRRMCRVSVLQTHTEYPRYPLGQETTSTHTQYISTKGNSTNGIYLVTKAVPLKDTDDKLSAIWLSSILPLILLSLLL